MNVLNIGLNKYLQNSLESDNKDICKGWNYLKEYITKELKDILAKKEYWDMYYNSQKVEYILKFIGIPLNEELKKQLESWVYIQNSLKREQEEKDKEQDILNKGYIKIYGNQKELDKKKVCGVFNISKIGIMGSFNKLEELEGTLIYSDYRKSLLLIPKRCRTRGFIIRDFAYIKTGV